MCPIMFRTMSGDTPDRHTPYIHIGVLSGVRPLRERKKAAANSERAAICRHLPMPMLQSYTLSPTRRSKLVRDIVLRLPRSGTNANTR